MSEKYPGDHSASDDHSGDQLYTRKSGNHSLAGAEQTSAAGADPGLDEHSARTDETALLGRSLPASSPVDANAATMGSPLGAFARTLAPESSASGRLESGHALPAPGERIGRYEIIRTLGHGGMGTVFLARDTHLGRLVALKLLRAAGPEMNQRFLSEAQTTAQCQHVNIVTLYEADVYKNQPYLALEYLRGESLASMLGQRGDDVSENPVVLPVARAVEIILPVVRALEHAHGAGIVHRDLKPGNIMLSESGVVKVLDFGVAKVLAEEAGQAVPDWFPAKVSTLRETQGAVGTPPFMSPEQLGGRDVDARTDIWAIGIILHKMVTGRHPLAPLSLEAVIGVSKLDVPMPLVGDKWPEIGPLGNIIDRCLIKSVTDRIASARALIDELEPLLSERGQFALEGDDNPFAGLSAFQESDADRFFGRTADIVNLVTRVRNQPLTMVTGPSGIGKSSLVRAGVIPTLKRSGEGWDAVTVRPGRNPHAMLVTAVAERWLSESSLEAQALRTQPGHLATEVRAWARRKRRRLLIFVDQFEELYTAAHEPDERAAFLACLAAIADDASSPLRVILSIRSDFLERMSDDRGFMNAATRGLVFLAPMDRDGLREALERPLQVVGHQFESSDMVGAMLDELQAESGALPLLQFTASQLWTARDREQRILTMASYRAMGGIAGTLARHADKVLDGMSTAQVRSARAILERLVTPERTRAMVSLGELRRLPGGPSEIDELLQLLIDARLLVVETGRVSDLSGSALAERVNDDGVRVELIHESLIDRWPTLARWLDDHQEDAAFRARLRTAAAEWDKGGRVEGVLWRGAAARSARSWDRSYTGQLGDRERAYLDAVSALAVRGYRRRRFAVVATIAILALLLVAASVGIVQIQGARQAAEQSERAARADQEKAERAVAAAERAEAEARASAAAAERETERAMAASELALMASEAENAARGQARDKAEEARLSRAEALSALSAARSAERRAQAARDKAQANAAQLQKANAKLQRLLNEKDALLRKHRIEKPILEQ